MRHSERELETLAIHHVTLAMQRFIVAQLAQASPDAGHYLATARASVTKDLELNAGKPQLSDEERQIMIGHGRAAIDRVFESIIVKPVLAGPASRN